MMCFLRILEGKSFAVPKKSVNFAAANGYRKRMVTISEIQFAGMIAMGALALTQVLQVPRRAAHHPIYGKARWLLFSGLALLTVQFFIQYMLGFRQMGVTQAVFVNLLFFMPCNVTISQAILFVQRQGHMSRREWMMGWRFYFVSAALLTVVALTDGKPFSEESGWLRQAEYVSAILYMIMQCHYFVLHCREYHRLRRALAEYYDNDRQYLLLWMALSVVLLALVGLFVPVIIFTQGWPLVAFSIFFFCTIYYCASSFHSYGISLDAQRVEEAAQSLRHDEAETSVADNVVLNEADRLRISEAAKRWIEAGGYLKPNLTLTSVSAGMDVQRYMLKAWLQESEYGKLSSWLNHLRTEEAKRLMAEHPEWSLDTISEHCGFSSRQYFHKVFHETTGITPTRFHL